MSMLNTDPWKVFYDLSFPKTKTVVKPTTSSKVFPEIRPSAPVAISKAVAAPVSIPVKPLSVKPVLPKGKGGNDYKTCINIILITAGVLAAFEGYRWYVNTRKKDKKV